MESKRKVLGDFFIGPRLGKGGEAYVHLGIHKATDKPFAIKIF